MLPEFFFGVAVLVACSAVFFILRHRCLFAPTHPGCRCSLSACFMPPNRFYFTWVCVLYPNYDNRPYRLMSCCRSDLLHRLTPTIVFILDEASQFIAYSVFISFWYDAYAPYLFLGIWISDC